MYNRSCPISSITIKSDKQVKLEQIELDIRMKLFLTASSFKDLILIREHHLYPPNQTFDEYSRATWGFPEAFVDALANAFDAVQDIGETKTGKLVCPFNGEQNHEFRNLTKDERIELALRVDAELAFREFSLDLVKQCKRELFPDKCVPIPP
jgi:hypothetical protein